MHDPTHQDKARSINRFRAAEFLRRLTTRLVGVTRFLEAAEACEVLGRLTHGAHAVHHGRRVGIGPWGVSWVYYQAVFWALGLYASCPPVHGELTLYAQGKTRFDRGRTLA